MQESPGRKRSRKIKKTTNIKARIDRARITKIIKDLQMAPRTASHQRRGTYTLINHWITRQFGICWQQVRPLKNSQAISLSTRVSYCL